MANPRNLDATFYVRRPPTFRFEDGLFFICHDVGRARFEFVMRPKVFAQALVLAEGARAEWQYSGLDKGNVSRLHKKK